MSTEQERGSLLSHLRVRSGHRKVLSPNFCCLSMAWISCRKKWEHKEKMVEMQVTKLASSKPNRFLGGFCYNPLHWVGDSAVWLGSVGDSSKSSTSSDSLLTPSLGSCLTMQWGGRMVPTPTLGYPQPVKECEATAVHVDMAMLVREGSQNLHTNRSGCLGGDRRSHSWVTQEKCSRGVGMHLWARPSRAPATVVDGPQAWVWAAETQREREREREWWWYSQTGLPSD